MAIKLNKNLLTQAKQYIDTKPAAFTQPKLIKTFYTPYKIGGINKVNLTAKQQSGNFVSKSIASFFKRVKNG
jgi:hypothetical protein